MPTSERKTITLPTLDKRDVDSAKLQPKSDNPNLVEQLDNLRERRADRKKMNRAALRREVVDACTLGVALMNDERMWHTFCAADWSGIRNPPQLGERQRAVFFAIKYMCGPGHEAQKEASFYFCAIDPFVREGILGDELLRAIELWKGFKALNDERRAREKSPYKKAIAASMKAESVSERHKQQMLTGEDSGNSNVDKKTSRERWDEDHPTQYAFEVSFPFHPSDILQARLPQRYLMRVKITKLGEKCVMKIEQYQKSKPKRRIGHRLS